MVNAILHDAVLQTTLFVLFASALIDTATGIYGAWKAGSFNAKFLDVFIPEHILKRIAPITLTIGSAVLLTGSPASVLLWAAAAAAVAAYETATVKSVLENLSGAPNTPDTI